MRTLWKLAVVFSLSLVLAGCFGREQPIYQVEQRPMPTLAENLTMDEIKQVMITAGARRKWVIREEAPGHLVGTLAIRKHQAVVDIRYNKELYNITYRSSQTLRYNAELKTIHRQYNSWVIKLERDLINALHSASINKG